MNIGIYGTGNFGFAITQHLSKAHTNNKSIKIFAFDRNEYVSSFLSKNRSHPYHHKQIKIKKNVEFINDPKFIFENCNIIILAITSNAIIQVLKQNQKFIDKKVIIINTAKALEIKSGKPFSKIVNNFPNIKKYNCSYAVLSGGTIASDLFHHEPLGADIGCKDSKSLNILKDIFTSDNLNIYTYKDLESIEYAGSFKNVVSILAGIINGLGLSYGSETHFITRASNEIINLLSDKVKINKNIFSINSQSWGNDLWLSCTGNTRNREYGILIGNGNSPINSKKKMDKKHKTVEGINTVKSLKKFKNLKQYPILFSIYNIVIKKHNPRKEINKLMASNKI